MDSRYISDANKKLILDRQKNRCANRPGSGLFRLNDYECLLWKLNKNKNKGRFDSSGYQFDHVIEFSLCHETNVDNLQALCANCHFYKTKDFMKERSKNNISSINYDDNNLRNSEHLNKSKLHYICEKCSTVFDNYDTYNNHIINAHFYSSNKSKYQMNSSEREDFKNIRQLMLKNKGNDNIYIASNNKLTPLGLCKLNDDWTLLNSMNLIAVTHKININNGNQISTSFDNIYTKNKSDLIIHKSEFDNIEVLKNANALVVLTGAAHGKYIGIDVKKSSSFFTNAHYLLEVTKECNNNTLSCITPSGGHYYVYKLDDRQARRLEYSRFDSELKLFDCDIDVIYNAGSLIMSGFYFANGVQHNYRIINNSAPINLPHIVFNEILKKIQNDSIGAFEFDPSGYKLNISKKITCSCCKFSFFNNIKESHYNDGIDIKYSVGSWNMYNIGNNFWFCKSCIVDKSPKIVNAQFINNINSNNKTMSTLEKRKQIISEMIAPYFCPICKKEFLEERDLITHSKPAKNGKSKCGSIVPRVVDKLQIFECISDNCIFCTLYKSSLVSHISSCKHIKNDKLINNNDNTITGDYNKVNQNIDHSTTNITINMTINAKNNNIKYSPDTYYSIDTVLKSVNPILELVTSTNTNNDTSELHNVIYTPKHKPTKYMKSENMSRNSSKSNKNISEDESEEKEIIIQRKKSPVIHSKKKCR